MTQGISRAFVLIFFVVIFASCTNSEKKSGTGSDVKTAYFQVKRLPLIGKKTWRGVVRSANRVELRSERRTKVAKILVENYQTVKKGQLLIELDRTDAENKRRDLVAKVKSLEVERQASQIKWTHAKRSVERKRPLLEKGIIPQKDYEDSQRELSLTETDAKGKDLELEKAKRDVSELDTQLQSTSIFAPMSGVLSGLINIESGNEEVSAGQLLAVVSDPNNLALWIAVEEGSVHRLNVGTKMNVSLDAITGSSFAGTVLDINASANNDGGRNISTRLKLYEVSVGFGVTQVQVREGLSGSATFQYENKVQAIAVPASALRSYQGKDALVVSAGASGSGEVRLVNTGIKTDNEVEILSGLSENEYVVVESN